METKVGLLHPRLRSDLVIERQQEGSTVRYLIVDPVQNRFWQCGAAQYQLLALFNGELALDEIVVCYREQTHIRLRPDQLDEVVQKLDAFGFLGQPLLKEKYKQSDYGGKKPRPFRIQDYVSKRWRICSAYQLLRPLEAYTRWLYTSTFLAVYVLLVLCACWIIVEGGWRQEVIPIWSGLYIHPSLLVWVHLILALIITGMVHECAHALTLLHFKRKPGFFGLGITLLGGLFFYVEISEVWYLSQRWQRVLVSLAGPLSSFLVGAIGAIVWWILPRSFPPSAWAATLMAVGFLTALYNCLPFFRTDGYFALSDWVRIPNLDRKAQTYILQTLFRPFRRQHESQLKFYSGQRIFIAAYGVFALLATLWFMLIAMDFCWFIVTVVLHSV